MSINPFELKAKKTEDTFMSWNELASRPYKKNTVDPYTKTRIILMNGTEYEAVWFGHNFSRKCDNNDIRRWLLPAASNSSSKNASRLSNR